MFGFTGKFPGNTLSSLFLVMAIAVACLWQTKPANAASFDKPDLTNHRTYMVNGLASAVPHIGYGLKNLQKKLGGKYYAYITPIEASGMEYRILKNIEREYRKNPKIRINLIGVSYGGNIATWVATRLARKRIPVNYLGVIDAPAPSPISSNVHRADNSRCRLIGCIGAPLRRTPKNKSTIMNGFTYRITHIRLPNDKRLQQRIIGQLTDTPLFDADDFIVDASPGGQTPANVPDGSDDLTGRQAAPAAPAERGVAKGYLPDPVVETTAQGNQPRSGSPPPNLPMQNPPAMAPPQGGLNAPMDLLRTR